MAMVTLLEVSCVRIALRPCSLSNQGRTLRNHSRHYVRDGDLLGPQINPVRGCWARGRLHCQQVLQLFPNDLIEAAKSLDHRGPQGHHQYTIAKYWRSKWRTIATPLNAIAAPMQHHRELAPWCLCGDTPRQYIGVELYPDIPHTKGCFIVASLLPHFQLIGIMGIAL